MIGVQYSGSGNTFILIDCRGASLSNPTQSAIDICESKSVDGLLIMEKSEIADIRMRIINPDGTEAEMCGNGARCAAHWAHHYASLEGAFKIQTEAGVLEALVNDDISKVRLTDPRGYKEVSELNIDDACGVSRFIDTGVPHLVTEMNDVSSVNVDLLGRKIRTHELFAPKGTNACFYEKKNKNEIRCRVYERGVEAETQACGTGSTASALMAAMSHDLRSPIIVEVESGERLRVYFKKEGQVFSDVYLEGPVQITKGEVNI